MYFIVPSTHIDRPIGLLFLPDYQNEVELLELCLAHLALFYSAGAELIGIIRCRVQQHHLLWQLTIRVVHVHSEASCMDLLCHTVCILELVFMYWTQFDLKSALLLTNRATTLKTRFVLTCRGEIQNGHFPPQCSRRIAKNLSI